MNLNCSKNSLLAGLCTIVLLGYSPVMYAAGGSSPLPAVQQAKKITGTVTDAMGPVIGASVVVKGTSNGVATDFDGNFTLNVNQGQTIVISYIGYLTKEIKVDGRSNYEITLEEDKKVLDEVVVVGYGTMKKSDISGASVSLGEDALKGSVITNLDQAFAGRAAGVTSMATSGAPGSSMSIRVRGQATINAGAEPLYVVDGVIMQTGNHSASDFGVQGLGNGSVSTISPLSTINPADIVSMEILKDASATAIYGAQGANGVVLITTKRGKAGEAKFTYDGQIAWNHQGKRLDLMNLREFADYYNDFVKTGYPQEDAYHSDTSLLGKGTNWQDAIFQTAFQQSHQIAAQGGTEKVQYYISGSYMDQEGTIIGSNFKRISTKVNLDAQLKPWLKLGLSATYANTKDDLKLADGTEGIIYYSLMSLPEIPIYNIDGSYASVVRENYNMKNPIAVAMANDNVLKRQKLSGNFFAEITPIKNLVWHAELGYDINYNRSDYYQPILQLPTTAQGNYSYWSKNNSTFWMLKNYITYTGQIDKHGFTAMLGQECWESKWDNMSIWGRDLTSDDFHNPYLGTKASKDFNDAYDSSAMASFFTRLTYNYDNRYNLTYTYRYDGSSNFGPNKRWAGFHSFAGSWRFSNEKFIEDIAGKWLSNGKLRIGWGQTGNSSIGGFRWGAATHNVTAYFESVHTGLRPRNIPNLDIHWEKQEQTNIGLDLGFLNDRINVTIDWYNKESKDMLMELQTPTYMGTQGNWNSKIDAPYGNFGHIRNRGFEVTLKVRPYQTKDFSWESELQASWNKNKLVALDGTAQAAIWGYGQWGDIVSKSVVGGSLFNFYGYVTDGVYKDYEDLANSPKPSWSIPTDGKYVRSQTVYVGDIKYKDISGPDGSPDGVIDEYDRTDLGSPFPKMTFGWTNTFTYKDFDLNIFINGSIGNKVLNYNSIVLTQMKSAWSNQLTSVNDRARLEPIDATKDYSGGVTTVGGYVAYNWYDDVTNVRVSNPGTDMPRAVIGDPNDNDIMSDRYIEDGSYLRIKNISLGYTFPKKWISKIKLENLRIYANIQNLWTITDYSGYDPEVGASTQNVNVFGCDNGRYPSPTTYSFGINVGF
ncbi:MAG: TonB-dependent receptor [Prevotella sp.]|nr:TonB-dependent receptor [Prevotella sp.]